MNRSLHVTVAEVREQTHDADWWRYHDLVVREVYGRAPHGTTERLTADPFRWAGHLGVAIGTLETEIGKTRSPDRLRTLLELRDRVTARKGDVVALRRRTELQVERDQARGALRQILDLIASGPDISDPSNADWHTVRAIATSVLNP